MDATTRDTLVDHLVTLINGGGAHLGLDRSVAKMPFDKQGQQPHGLPYSPWQLLEHLRIALVDIVEFSAGTDHESPPWPEGYWPTDPAPPGETAWDDTLAEIHMQTDRFLALLRDPARDLLEPFPWGTGQTLHRQATLIADHNAWHLGQLVVVRRLLDCWPPTT